MDYNVQMTLNDFPKLKKSFTLETPLYGGGCGSVTFNFDHITIDDNANPIMWYRFNSECEQLSDVENICETLHGFFHGLIIDNNIYTFKSNGVMTKINDMHYEMKHPEGQLFGLTTKGAPTLKEVITRRASVLKSLADDIRYNKFLASLDEDSRNAVIETKEYMESEAIRNCMKDIIRSIFEGLIPEED